MSCEKKIPLVLEADFMTVGRIMRQAEKEGIDPATYVENFFTARVADTHLNAQEVADTSKKKPA